jgi:hypothetical protein
MIVALPLLCSALSGLFHFGSGMPLIAAIGIGAFALLFGLAFYFGRLGWRVVLRRDTVDFQQWGTIVRCPWSLFASDWLPQADGFWENILIPIREEWTAEVSLIRYGRVRAQGIGACTLQCSFPTGSKMRVRGYYGVDLQELGLLMHALAHSAAHSALETQILPAFQSNELPDHVSAESRWRQIDLARLALPQRCCGCAGEDELKWRNFEVRTLISRVIGGTVRTYQLPICKRCHRRQLRIMLLAFASATIIAITGLALWHVLTTRQFDAWELLGTSLLGLFGGCVGLVGSWYFTTPARFRWLSNRRETVRLWVRDPRCWEE